MDYVDEIRNAQVYDVAKVTPLDPAEALSSRTGNTILLKREDLQPVFSFKVRGAANKIASLKDGEVGNGVICSSAGNHAQGVALAASKRGIPAHIVMPADTPSIKVEAVKKLGGSVTLHGEVYDEAQALALTLAAEKNLCFIHPFDDPMVIAGQGTVGKEILEQCNHVDAIFIAIGGGGLASGIASFIKSMRPEVLIIGVEPTDAASMKAALEAGHPVDLDEVGVFADGVATRRVGTETFRLCQQLLDDVITVSTDQTCAAISDIYEATRSIVEPSGALSVAGIKRYVEDHHWSGKTVVGINCGANMNFDRLRHISERAAIGQKSEALLAVEIPETKGSFLAFCRTIKKRQVTEFNYRHQRNRTAQIFVGLALQKGTTERHRITESLADAGYPVTDLTDNELAKLHIRHLAGGTTYLQHERLYRFQFPERQGALLKFLEAVGVSWNISLFHYRNHGSDYGRVLVGVEVPPETNPEFDRHLAELGYRFWDETDNDAYRSFLQPQQETNS